MKFEFDTHKCAKMLVNYKFTSVQADGIIKAISHSEVTNLLTKQEVNLMLSDAMQAVLKREDKRLAEQRREFDKRIGLYERRFDSRFTREFAELKASNRWVIGTIITVGLALPALMHFVH